MNNKDYENFKKAVQLVNNILATLTELKNTGRLEQ